MAIHRTSSRIDGPLGYPTMRNPLQRWRARGGGTFRLALQFDDIMEVALARLALSPHELTALGWSFADRKRLLNHFLASGRAMQRAEPAALGRTLLALRLPLRDVRRLQTFIHRELPKAASNAAVLDRLRAILDTAPAGGPTVTGERARVPDRRR